MVGTERVLQVIYSLQEVDRQEDMFKPVVEAGNLVWRFEIKEFDDLGLLVNHIEIKSHEASSLALDAQSQLLKNKITYLEEDFKLVENDRANAVIVLRSNIPHQVENTLNYYEVILRGGNHLSFGRFEYDKMTGKRRSRAANLSKETFKRLLVDFDGLFATAQ